MIEASDFLNAPGVILDVRSPGEFSHAHIPGAINLPLFSDSERSQVGTTYKKVGREAAIEQGLAIVGPKLHDFVKQAKQHVKNDIAKVHCWRGGMRSSSMAWLLSTAGLKTATLKGGYKAFRQWVLSTFSVKHRIFVIGGLTGSGKTQILQALKQNGEQILDLESLANHRGSSYGMLGMPLQPSNEHFENKIAVEWAAFDPARPVWMEDESRLIGSCKIPDSLFSLMRAAPLFIVKKPFSERLGQLLKDYGSADRKQLIEATQRISRRLGSLRAKEIIQAIEAGRLDKAIEMTLQYYDAAYLKGIDQRKQTPYKIYKEGLSASEWAQEITHELPQRGLEGN